MKHLKAATIIIMSVIFFVLSFFFFHDIRPTMLLQTFAVEKQPTVFWDEILPKKSFVYTFVAGEDNLGIIEVRFQSYKHQDNYVLLFQLRESGATATIYERIYYLFPFEQERLFPFGFPVIADSRGKHYEVTISSIGNKNSPVAVSHVYPSVTAKYYVPLTQLKTQGVSTALTFVNKKITNTLTNWQFIMNAIFFLCPITFLLYRVCFKLETSKTIFLGLVTNVILFSSLGYMVVVSGFLLLYVIACFLVAKHIFGWTYEIPLLSTLFCMLGAVGALAIGRLMIAEQFAIYILPTSICYLYYVVFDKSISVRKMPLALTKVQLICIMSLLAVIFTGVLYYGYKRIKAIIYINQSDTPIIFYVGPTIVYNSSADNPVYVLIKGSGYGSQYNGHIRIMSTFGEIEESSWTNTDIIFRVPTEWTPGTFSVWMERKVDNIWMKISNDVYTMKLIDKNKPWTIEDDQYYEQMTSGPKELPKVNEYTIRGH